MTFDPQRRRLPLWRSFYVASRGVVEAFWTQRNFRIHLMATVVVLAGGIWLQVSRLEWCLLLFSVGVVMGTELLNTSIEALVDLVSPEDNELARIAKDIAAGAVLTVSIMAVAVGALIFVPALWEWMRTGAG